jgi:hypothetical protein
MMRLAYISCEICGEEMDSRAIEKHYVIPRVIMAQARMRRAKIIRVCPKCMIELQDLYKGAIDMNVYDTQIGRFRARLPVELVKEYRGAFNRYARFKKTQRQLV